MVPPSPPTDGERVFTQPQPQQTRAWIFSDLHLEWDSNAWDPVPPPAFDVVVAAGDVAQQLPDALRWLHDRFPGVPVIYTPGNHDYWNTPKQQGRPWTDVLTIGRDLAARWDIHLLSDDAVVIDGCRFVGATLWTDYRLGQTKRADAFGSAWTGFRDYRRIRRPSVSGKNRKVQPADLAAQHQASRTFLEDALSIPHAGRTVVVTHHAPHPGSLVNRHRDGLDHVYASDLTPVIQAHAPALWVHGHIHGVADYVVGDTRIVSNARGHVGEETSAQAFRPQFVVEV